MTRIIAIEQAEPGMMIVRVTAQNGPVKINKSGLISSPAMIQGLIEMGVQEIEYDPDQTVEICQEIPLSTTEQTPTQALLRGQFDTRAQKTDSAISDQFNRSLFLPSVSGLPGWWQRGVKPAVLAIVMALGGAATGYALALLPEVLSQALTPTESTRYPTPATRINSAPSPAASVDNTPAQTNEKIATAPQRQQQDVSESELPAGPQTSPNRQDNPVNTAENGVSPSAPVADELAATTGTQINAEAPEKDVAVSPELMARFNKVMSDLEQQEERGEPINNDTVVNIHDDIQRVDQLPARLLTRLPSMDFSAHMYASRPADRWLRVNGEDKSEGDWISDRVQIVNIEAQRVILRFEGEVFAMAALTDW
ncbi:general secretion pathway protein GspB [Alteromonas gilva]|uniref:General secretion pathway protein GspB n=1 Tax=Alteromonas gilva TaxID=2987522 RepID=A0ABT5L6H1_9ALTE|nr:general secretion pathway protein GspB [Alteromonas gilva]MDC8832647.1 general secretion pathway protein GspB [Alteromonas gilva]